ncbi:MAG: DUF2156 domain-containing protein [Desulfuromonadia bacterium]
MSELSFGNLWLFRHAHDYRLTSLEGGVVVMGKGYDGLSYCLPPLSGDPLRVTRSLFLSGMTLYGDRESAVRLPLGLSCSIVDDRDNADYLYARQDLAELPGNRYHRKRNRISYLLSRHSCIVEPFDERHQPRALALIDDWERSRGDSSPSSLLETGAAREGVERFRELGLFGVAVREGGRLLGFALGERLNSRTVVCHFEKGDPFIEGVSQLLNREFARMLPPEIDLLNREQDLGDEGLRQAKLSYHPVKLLEKVRVRCP